MSTKKVLRPTLRLMLALVAVTALWSVGALAQPADADGPAAVEAPAGDAALPAEADEPITYKSLFQILKNGGVMMIPLFVCSFFMLVFVFERAISLRRGRIVPGPFVKRFLHQVREGKFDRESALVLCEESSSPVAEVFGAVVKKWGRPSVEIEQTIIDAEDRVAPGLRAYVRLFSAVATISPLLGLLGTVVGMIRLFDAISDADAMGRTELLAAGISEALLTTAAGLLIAIPALLFHLYFVGRVERLLMAIDELAQELAGYVSAEALHDDRRRGKGRSPNAA
ncbi:MAG: MotA/TolQ/ExbB proton channel family protein [Planctomycetota bacterium]|nr:MAG: MotA/TolQ/ExbB proton channel family protein [Planctomycetota bacterium]